IRGLGIVGFGDNVTTSGVWEPSDNIAFRAQLLTGANDTFKWRAGTYATYTNYGWKWGTVRSESTAARSVLLGGDVAGDAPGTTDPSGGTFRDDAGALLA